MVAQQEWQVNVQHFQEQRPVADAEVQLSVLHRRLRRNLDVVAPLRRISKGNEKCLSVNVLLCCLNVVLRSLICKIVSDNIFQVVLETSPHILAEIVSNFGIKPDSGNTEKMPSIHQASIDINDIQIVDDLDGFLDGFLEVDGNMQVVRQSVARTVRDDRQCGARPNQLGGHLVDGAVAADRRHNVHTVPNRLFGYFAPVPLPFRIAEGNVKNSGIQLLIDDGFNIVGMSCAGYGVDDEDDTFPHTPCNGSDVLVSSGEKHPLFRRLARQNALAVLQRVVERNTADGRFGQLLDLLLGFSCAVPVGIDEARLVVQQ